MNVSAAAKSGDTLQTARYVNISVRHKRATFVTGLTVRIVGHMRAAEGARARRQLSKGNYPKECWPDRHFIWLGPQQAVILPEFHAILLSRSNPSLIAQSRPIGPA
jgi:hypothetical protein